MMPWLTERVGNPSGAHRSARAARRAVDDSRDMVAAALGVDPGGIIFTSGGTEADNLAVFGALAARPGRGVCSAIEHHAVLGPIHARGGTVVPVTDEGEIDLDALDASLDAEVTFVSVMMANNETGRIQPIEAVARLVRRRSPEAVIHVDAVQAMPWLDLSSLGTVVDLISISGHKLGAPQGVGVLAVRSGVAISPVVLGGGQERERRSGTHNVPGIVALGAAIGALVEHRADDVAHVHAFRDRLLDGLLAGVPGLVETGGATSRDRRLPGHAHVRVPGVEGEALLFLLEQAGIDASAAASCASGAQQLSHVLVAMGLSEVDIRGAVRLTLGPTSTSGDVDHPREALPAAVAQLRSRAA